MNYRATRSSITPGAICLKLVEPPAHRRAWVVSGTPGQLHSIAFSHFQELLGLRDQTRATEGRSFMPVYEQNSNGELPAEIKSMLCNWPVSGSGSRLVHRHILTLADRLSHYVGTDEVFALIRDSMPRRPKTWRMVLMAALSAQGT